jgi:hypothetical protein
VVVVEREREGEKERANSIANDDGVSGIWRVLIERT